MLLGWLIIVGVAIVGCFGVVLLVGAPFLPTLKPQITAALDLLDLKPGQTVLELGCGDGRVLIAAAQRGWRAVGYELNPLLALLSWLRTRRYAKQISVVWGDYWGADWPPAEGIFAFLLPRYMRKLDKKIMHYKHKPVVLVSFAFPVPNRSEKGQRANVFRYEYTNK